MQLQLRSNHLQNETVQIHRHCLAVIRQRGLEVRRRRRHPRGISWPVACQPKGTHVVRTIYLQVAIGVAPVAQGGLVPSEQAEVLGAISARNRKAGCDREGRVGGADGAMEIAITIQQEGESVVSPHAVQFVPGARQALQHFLGP
ncbi:MAG: hypothetical protein ABIW30_05330 [Arenimonas sp.]